MQYTDDESLQAWDLFMQKYSRLLLQMLFNSHLWKLGSKSLTQQNLPGMCGFWDVSWGLKSGLVTVRQEWKVWWLCLQGELFQWKLWQAEKPILILINLQQHSWSSKQNHSCARFCTNIIKDGYLKAKYTKQTSNRVKEVLSSPFHSMRPEMDREARLFTSCTAFVSPLV